MRQAGRYHSHYQKLKESTPSSIFARIPELACEVTMGPIRDFGFDAAILFSDLLFPLEAMGMGLRYDPGPKLDWHLRNAADLKKLSAEARRLRRELAFQAEAMQLIRATLPRERAARLRRRPAHAFLLRGRRHPRRASSPRRARDSRTGASRDFVERLVDLLWPKTWRCRRARARIRSRCSIPARASSSPTAYRTRRRARVCEACLREFKRALPADAGHLLLEGAPVPRIGTSFEGLPIACLGIDWHARSRRGAARLVGRFRDPGKRRSRIGFFSTPPSSSAGCAKSSREVKRAARGAAPRLGLRPRARRACRRRPRQRAALPQNSKRDIFGVDRHEPTPIFFRKYNVPGPALHELSHGSLLVGNARPPSSGSRASARALDESEERRHRRRALRAHPVLRVALHLLRMQHADHAQSRRGRPVCPDRAQGVGALSRAPRRARSRSPSFIWAAARRRSLTADELEQLVDGHSRRRRRSTKPREFSVEADPRVTTREHLERLAKLGFRRLSLGIQDFDPKVQEIVHRVQSAEQVRAVTRDRARAGFRRASTTI